VALPGPAWLPFLDFNARHSLADFQSGDNANWTTFALHFQVLPWRKNFPCKAVCGTEHCGYNYYVAFDLNIFR